VKRHLRPGIEPGGSRVQQNRADTFTNLGPPRLTCGHHVDSLRSQHRRQVFQLGGFAAAVKALECNEPPAHFLSTHAVIISTAAASLVAA